MQDLIHQFYDMLLESQYWPRQQLVDYQRSQLEQLLRHARANVPFYEHRLDPVFARDGSVNWDKWGEIPIVKRADLIDHRGAMRARVLPPGHGQTKDFMTSGSTGAPIVTTHNTLASLASQAAVYRSHGWHGLDRAESIGSWYGDDPVIGAWPEGSPECPWGPFWEQRSAWGRFHEVNRITAAAQVLEYIERKNLTYFLGGATDMQLLAHEAERLRLRIGLDAIVTRSAMLSQSGRNLLERVFGARVFPLYSSKEGHKMAHPCPTGGRYHVNAEIVLVEVVDEAGTPCAAGETGRVIITPFFSTAQPIIRYEQGDFAIAGPVCACGRNLPVLADVVGRIKHLFALPGGIRVVPRLPAAPIEGLNASAFQIAQIGPTEIEVRYVPLSSDSVADEETLAAAIHAEMHPDLKVTFKRLDAFPTALRRKHIEYVSEFSGT